MSGWPAAAASSSRASSGPVAGGGGGEARPGQGPLMEPGSPFLQRGHQRPFWNRACGFPKEDLGQPLAC